MPAAFLVRLSRIIPLLVLLAVLAVVVYAVVSWRSSPNRAKEVLIRLFTVLGAGIALFFALAAAYAAFESNWVAVEIAAMFGAVGVITLAVAQVCRWRFVRNHPAYKHGQEEVLQAEVITPIDWKGILLKIIRIMMMRYR